MDSEDRSCNMVLKATETAGRCSGPAVRPPQAAADPVPVRSSGRLYAKPSMHRDCQRAIRYPHFAWKYFAVCVHGVLLRADGAPNVHVYTCSLFAVDRARHPDIGSKTTADLQHIGSAVLRLMDIA